MKLGVYTKYDKANIFGFDKIPNVWNITRIKDISSIISKSGAFANIHDYLITSNNLIENILEIYPNTKNLQIEENLSKVTLIKNITKIYDSSKELRKSYPSIMGGCQIKSGKGKPGTLGAIVKDKKSDDYYILSAMHVLYGDKCFDLNCKSRSIYMKLNNKQESIAENFLDKNQLKKLKPLDIALSKIKTNFLNHIKPGVKLFGTVKDKVNKVKECDKVKKYGARTDDEHGHVMSGKCLFSYTHEIFNQPVIIKDALLMNDISQDGDSGAVLLTEDNNEVLGVIVGGKFGSHSAAVRIEQIKTALLQIGIEIDFNF